MPKADSTNATFKEFRPLRVTLVWFVFALLLFGVGAVFAFKFEVPILGALCLAFGLLFLLGFIARLFAKIRIYSDRLVLIQLLREHHTIFFQEIGELKLEISGSAGQLVFMDQQGREVTRITRNWEHWERLSDLITRGIDEAAKK